MRTLLVGAALVVTMTRAQAASPKDLEGDDDAAAETAARELGDGNDPQAVPALVAALEKGAPPKVQAAMLAALAKKKDARALGIATQYAHNRNAEVRRAALAALASINDARASQPIVAALSDSDTEVRAQAAAAIAQRRQKGAEEPLIKLMQHRDMAAAGALGAIATPGLAHRLSELIGQAPDPILCTALGEMLKRSDFGPEPIRLEVVKTLAKVPGVDSTAVLVEYIAATERDKNRPSRLEAQRVVDERSRE
jgi:HEAT repeat protein